MEQPVVTVLLPHYRCEAFLYSAVQSILGQIEVSLRLIVVDDASASEGWIDVLRPFRGDRRLSTFRADRNVGPYRLKNRILDWVETPCVAFQDADDLSEPTRLATQLRVLEKAKADIVGTSFRYISTEGEPVSRKRMPGHVNLWLRLGKSFSLLHPTMLIRRSAITSLGGFDGTTRIAADSDFLLRAAHLFRIVNARELLYNYRLRSDSLTGAAATGHDSALRRAYLDAMWQREKKRRSIRTARALDASLRAPANDTDFRLEPVRL